MESELNPGFFETPVVGISLYKNVIDPHNFIDFLERCCSDDTSDIEWLWSITGDGYGSGRTSEYRSSMNCSLHPLLNLNLDRNSPDGNLKNIFEREILSKLRIPIVNYQTTYRIDSAYSEPYQVLKYTENAGYRAHYDCGKSLRVFSLVASLAEADSGGELEFPFFNYKVKLETGDVVIFPSNHPYTHIAHPIDSGVKYSLVSWFS
jgi:hypothetical protein